ncbi:MAG TPA: 50S ribosomal protein L25 [Patescibacteria group bacterium]|jgi:large subunit ribosomal protein L25
MTQTTFQAQKRTAKKPHQLRREGVVPANIFGGGQSQAIQIQATNFAKLYEQVGETGLVYLEIVGDKNQHPVLVEEVQTDPVSGELLHVSLKQVNLTEKIEAQVPVETIGEFDVTGGVLMVVKDEIQVEALPADLPEKFEIDISLLTEVGQMITYANLQYDKNKVSLILGEEGEEEPIILVQEQREEEPEEEPEVIEGEEGEVSEGESAGEKSEKPADKTEKPAEKGQSNESVEKGEKKAG